MCYQDRTINVDAFPGRIRSSWISMRLCTCYSILRQNAQAESLNCTSSTVFFQHQRLVMFPSPIVCLYCNRPFLIPVTRAAPRIGDGFVTERALGEGLNHGLTVAYCQRLSYGAVVLGAASLKKGPGLQARTGACHRKALRTVLGGLLLAALCWRNEGQRPYQCHFSSGHCRQRNSSSSCRRRRCAMGPEHCRPSHWRP